MESDGPSPCSACGPTAWLAIPGNPQSAAAPLLHCPGQGLSLGLYLAGSPGMSTTSPGQLGLPLPPGNIHVVPLTEAATHLFGRAGKI